MRNWNIPRLHFHTDAPRLGFRINFFFSFVARHPHWLKGRVVFKLAALSVNRVGYSTWNPDVSGVISLLSCSRMESLRDEYTYFTLICVFLIQYIQGSIFTQLRVLYSRHEESDNFSLSSPFMKVFYCYILSASHRSYICMYVSYFILVHIYVTIVCPYI